MADHHKLSGNGSIAVRIGSIEPIHNWTKAGVIIRDRTASDSVFATVYITPENRICLQYRSTVGKDALSIHTNRNAIILPHWIKLIREGNTFKTQHSEDDKKWKNIEGSSLLVDTTETCPAIAEIEMKDPVRIGMAVCSHAGPAVTAEAKISNVTVTGEVEPAGEFIWSEDIGFQAVALPKK